MTVGITGLWLAARHWWGWLIGAAGEVLWVGYAITRHDHALFLMAWVWFAVNIRNAVVTRRKSRGLAD